MSARRIAFVVLSFLVLRVVHGQDPGTPVMVPDPLRVSLTTDAAGWDWAQATYFRESESSGAFEWVYDETKRARIQYGNGWVFQVDVGGGWYTPEWWYQEVRFSAGGGVETPPNGEVIIYENGNGPIAHRWTVSGGFKVDLPDPPREGLVWIKVGGQFHRVMYGSEPLGSYRWVWSPEGSEHSPGWYEMVGTGEGGTGRGELPPFDPDQWRWDVGEDPPDPGDPGDLSAVEAYLQQIRDGQVELSEHVAGSVDESGRRVVDTLIEQGDFRDSVLREGFSEVVSAVNGIGNVGGGGTFVTVDVSNVGFDVSELMDEGGVTFEAGSVEFGDLSGVDSATNDFGSVVAIATGAAAATDGIRDDGVSFLERVFSLQVPTIGQESVWTVDMDFSGFDTAAFSGIQGVDVGVKTLELDFAEFPLVGLIRDLEFWGLAVLSVFIGIRIVRRGVA